MNSNGTYVYQSTAGALGAESVYDRQLNERHWRAFGKKIRKELPTAWALRRRSR